MSDAQRQLTTLDAERQQWVVSKARLKERLAAAAAAAERADKLAEQSAAALLDSRAAAEALRIHVSRQQEQLEALNHRINGEKENNI